jgi:hypothetical protein
MQLETLGAENFALSGLRFWRFRRVVFGAVGLRFLAPSRRALALSGLALSGLSVAPVGRVAVAVALALRPSVRGSRGSRGSRPWRGGECSGYLTREKCDLWKSQGLSTRYPQPPVDNRDFGGLRRKIYSLSVAIRTLSVAVNSLSVAAELNPAVS